MSDATESRVLGSVLSSKEREAILAESQYIVSHPSFRTSKRCVDLFRYIIACVLQDDPTRLKERTLGIEVFGRNPEYDTNADPIVRMTANEIRKRLAVCYQEGDHSSCVRIYLFPGSYSPQFEFSRGKEPVQTTIEIPQHHDSVWYEAKPEDIASGVDWHDARGRRRLLWACAGLVLCGLMLGGWLFLAPQFSSTQDLVWAPLLQGHQPVMVCVQDQIGLSTLPVNSTWADVIAKILATHEIPASLQSNTQVPTMDFVDAQAASQVVASIDSLHGKAYMRGTSTLTLPDLRRGPDVLIGAFDNPWALILLSGLRYHVLVDPVTQVEWIADARNPADRRFAGSGFIPYANTSVDYALITRVRSPETGTWILAIGGLGLHGTESGSELITDPNLSRELPRMARNTQKNFQIVIETTVINGSTGPPKVVATYFW